MLPSDRNGQSRRCRFSAKETRIASFRIAVNQVRSNAAGEREESTEWFRITVGGRQAEYASHLQKGQRVLVDGRLQITHFQRKDGTPGVGFDVWADEVQNAGARTTAETEDGHAPVGVGTGDVANTSLDDDLPFYERSPGGAGECLWKGDSPNPLSGLKGSTRAYLAVRHCDR